MEIPMTVAGVLRRENGLLMARGVTLTVQVNHEMCGPAEFKVYDDPAFSRRYTGDRFVFIPSHDPSQEFGVRIIDSNGACVVAPVGEGDCSY